MSKSTLSYEYSTHLLHLIPNCLNTSFLLPQKSKNIQTHSRPHFWWKGHKVFVCMATNKQAKYITYTRFHMGGYYKPHPSPNTGDDFGMRNQIELNNNATVL